VLETVSEATGIAGEPSLPVVTVITPAYNVGKYIGEAVGSVMGQTFIDFEYLIVDDGSADNTVEVARTHINGDPRVRIIHGTHAGHSAARNAGLREARGRYVAFLDGDDRWHRNFLRRQVSLLESLPATVGAVFCRSRVILENGTTAFFQWQPAGGYDFDKFLISSNPARNGSSLLIRKSCFDEVGGFDESILSAADLEMWLRIADRSSAPVMWASRYFLVDWRLRPGSVTRNRRARDTAMLQLLGWQAAKLRHSPAGLAYVRPAAAALKYGADDDIADQLAMKARTAGTARLVRTVAGLELLAWHTLPRPGRRAARGFQSFMREAVKSANRRLRG
jgi:glycosyltransferase involved in cell wall biosynthesis